MSVTKATTIVWWEFRRRKWSTIWWIIGIGAFLALTILVYPTFKDQAAQLDQSLNQLPDSAKALFTDTKDFLSPVGYLSSQIYYLMMPLLLSFLAISLGASLIARDEQNHTLELLLARPISRTKLLLAKALSGLFILLLVGGSEALLACILVSAVGFNGVRTIDVALVTLMSLLFALLFGALAYMLTALGKFGRGASIGIATLLALGGYIISSLDSTVTWLAWPAKFLPFHYYHPADILRGHFQVASALGMALGTVVLLVLAILAFRRRDIE